MLTSAALVLRMTIPGLFLFYGGLVRGKNVLGTIMHSFIIVALISIQWVLWGYSLAFGPDQGGIIGSLAWLGLNGVGADPNPDYAATIPHQTFMIYQLMFAIITPALITGTFAERVKFSTFIVFILLWATFIYDPLAHWVWGKAVGWVSMEGWERWTSPGAPWSILALVCRRWLPRGCLVRGSVTRRQRCRRIILLCALSAHRFLGWLGLVLTLAVLSRPTAYP